MRLKLTETWQFVEVRIAGFSFVMESIDGRWFPHTNGQ